MARTLSFMAQCHVLQVLGCVAQVTECLPASGEVLLLAAGVLLLPVRLPSALPERICGVFRVPFPRPWFSHSLLVGPESGQLAVFGD